MAKGEPVLSLQGVHRRYVRGPEQLAILKGADLALWPGEIVGLVGPSGSGKSSLLHAAGLLERPTAGAITVAGHDCSGLGDRGRTRLRLQYIGFVYQMPHLLPELSALDNVALPRLIAGASRRDANLRAEALLDELGLGARGAHQPAQLSGGEQQRVAIARALINEPKVILADEPTGNLDPATSNVVFERLLALARRHDAAGLVATHDMNLAQRMDRVYALRDGVLVPG